MDYCGTGCNNITANGTAAEAEDKRVVRLKFLRDQLLYDIKNYAWVESDVMVDELEHAKHLTADICESGNVDRVSRILSVVHVSLIDLLYPYTKREPIEEEIDDKLSIPDEYVIELRVPLSMSGTTLHHLSKLIHEYMVYCVLADWLSITCPEVASKWLAKAEAMSDEIERTKNQRGVFTRKMHPF